MSNRCRVITGEDVSSNLLCAGFNQGFQDYKYGTQFSPSQLQTYLQRSGVVETDCAVLVADGHLGVGIALLALDGGEAWCAGLAVAPGYRRSGYASSLMAKIEANAIEQGASRLYLEVLTENQAALTLYQRLGYKTLRTLRIWQRRPDDKEAPASHASKSQLPNVTRIDPALLLSRLTTNPPKLRPAWQRSPHFVKNLSGHLSAVEARPDGRHGTAYALYQRTTSDASAAPQLRITDIGSCPPEEESSLAIHTILMYLSQTYPDAVQTLLNEPDDSLLSVHLAAGGFRVVESQFEMAKDLM